MNKPFKALIKNTKTLSEQMKWSQADLARKLHWDPGNLSTYLSGKREPSLDKIAEIADVFGISTSELLEERAEPKAQVKKPSVEESLEVINEVLSGDLFRLFSQLAEQDPDTLRAVLDGAAIGKEKRALFEKGDQFHKDSKHRKKSIS